MAERVVEKVKFGMMQDYHPSRVLTLVYQPFALGTLSILAYNEAKINTRQRNLFGYFLFFISSLVVLIVSSTKSTRGYETVCLSALYFVSPLIQLIPILHIILP